QETEAGDGTLHGGWMSTSTDVKNDLAVEEAASTHHVDAWPALLQHIGRAISEEHNYVVPSAEMGEGPDDMPCSAEETCPTDPEESSSNENISAGTDILSPVMAEEMTTCITVSEGDVGLLITDGGCYRTSPAEESDEVQEDSVESLSGSTAEAADVPQHDEVPCTPSQDEDSSTFEDETSPINVSPADVEPHIHTDVSFQRNMVEELTCLVREIHLADVSQDSEKEPEMDTDDYKSEQSPSSLNKKFDDSVLTEKTSFVEDSFEAQLSKITHLSLIIKDGADAVLAEQQPEE
ncbi:hypothetical protein AMECASPLE_020828, partial [Ameca splendens]